MAYGTLGRGLTRRDFLKVGGGAAVGASTLGLAGCGGGDSGDSGALSMLVWAGAAEERAYRNIIRRYESQNPDAKISLQVQPFDQVYSSLDTGLASGEAPDLVRLQYQQMGRYSSQGALLDLSEYTPGDYGSAFTPGLWNACIYEDTPYGVPQHTDTMAVFYNAERFDRLGVEIPRSLEEAWTWEEFLELSGQLQRQNAADYPFAMAWQDGTAYRWMWLLSQNGGSLLNENLSGPDVDTPAGVEAIEFCQGWFEDDLVPPNTSVKSGEAIESLFANGTIAMMLNGDWLIPFLVDNMDEEWGVTYMIQNEEMASDLGGNAVAATRDTVNPEMAADFLQFLANEESMAEFCTTAQFIPTRKKLVEQGLDYETRPEEMSVFVEQSTTVPQEMAREQTIPEFSGINQVLVNELEAAFKTGQAADQTAANIASGIEQELED